MQIDFLMVLITVLSLVILIIPGFLLAKTKLISQQAGSYFSTMVLYGCQPLLMIMSFQKATFSTQILINMAIVFALAFLVHFIMIGVAVLVYRHKYKGTELTKEEIDKKAKLNCAKFATIFGNCGYMGLPFLQTLFSGELEIFQGEVMAYCGIVLAVFNILNWTVGVYIYSNNKKDISIKKIIFNPTIIGVVLGFVIFVIFKQPIVNLAPANTTMAFVLEKLMSSINFLGNMVTPLSMTVIGIKLANIKFSSLFTNKLAYSVSFFKLIVASIITMLVVGFLPISQVVKYALFFTLSMPSATSTTLFAIQFKGDGETASIMVLLSTILSIITIPLMFLVFANLFGLAM